MEDRVDSLEACVPHQIIDSAAEAHESLLPTLRDDEVASFHERGFLVVRGAVREALVEAMRRIALRDLAEDRGPLEREAQVGYPGAPADPGAVGGRTVRRLLRAYDRGEPFRRFVEDPSLAAALRALLGVERVHFVQSHHNCVMTKQPRYSSDTGWHQDVRYWRFSDHELVNAWLALTPESSPNGSLRLLPGSHRLNLGPERFDDALFLREDLPANRDLLSAALQVELAPGDVLFFHAAAFHYATRNYTAIPKLSAVFTFHGEGTTPLPASKSSGLAEIPLPPRAR